MKATTKEPPKYYLNEEQEKKEILRNYRALMKMLRPKLKKGDKELLRNAFEMAAEAHSEMRRKSGEPYILHPLAVAMICVEEIGLGVRSAICALLHDTVEDTHITLEDIQREFGNEIPKIVDGLTKISTVSDTSASSSQQAENFKKILLTLTDDPRVILIKLADRLHNMRTLDFMKTEKQLKIASETIFVYAPLAHRMGLYEIKTEMEDLAMKYMEPDKYKEIAKKLAETKRERNRYINEFIKPIREKLEKNGFSFEIYGRPKSIHSIWNKMKKKGIEFEEVYDLFAIRVIIDSEPNKEKEACWKVYSLITDEYTPSPERLRDWLSNPKSNGYEALHTTVMGGHGKWVEVQIRSRRMNEIAEKGLAAHYKYKEDTTAQEEDRFEKWFSQIREAMVTGSDSVDFLQDFKTSFLVEDIYVYTPKGEVKMLPIGSTALDFAFSIHTAVGSQCIGAKVNHRLVPIGHKLRSGDQVEIITSQKQKPSEDWLNYVVTAKAKNKIKDALKEEKRKVAEDGKYTLMRKLDNMKAAFSAHNIEELYTFYKLNSQLDLFYQIATKKIDLKELKDFKVIGDKLEQPRTSKSAHAEVFEDKAQTFSKKDSELIIFGESSDKIMYSLAKCCHPIPGDDVFGFISTGKGMIIHRTSCPNATQLLSNYGHRIVKTRWANSKEISFLTGIEIIGLDDFGMINRITTVVSNDMRINISSMSIESESGYFKGKLKVFVRDKEELDRLIIALKKVEGVEKVTRFDADEKG